MQLCSQLNVLVISYLVAPLTVASGILKWILSSGRSGFPGAPVVPSSMCPWLKEGWGCEVWSMMSSMITQAVKTSPDLMGRTLASYTLDVTIQKRHGDTEGPEDSWPIGSRTPPR